MPSEAEAVLINSKGGDIIADRLPTAALFDHVLVRALVGDRAYWLDATRLGDKYLSALPPSDFGWALPLRKGQLQLVNVRAETPALPLKVEVVKIDASAGFDARAKVHFEEILRGDLALQLQTQLVALSPEDQDRAEKAVWRKKVDWTEPESVFWRYDEKNNVIDWGMDGQGKPGWTGDDVKGHSLEIPGAGFTPPNVLRRPKE